MRGNVCGEGGGRVGEVGVGVWEVGGGVGGEGGEEGGEEGGSVVCVARGSGEILYSVEGRGGGEGRGREERQRKRQCQHQCQHQPQEQEQGRGVDHGRRRQRKAKAQSQKRKRNETIRDPREEWRSVVQTRSVAAVWLCSSLAVATGLAVMAVMQELYSWEASGEMWVSS